MNKSKFTNKRYGTGHQRNFVFLEYEYRGKQYEVYENNAKGNIPLSWQHKNEQLRIDSEIEREEQSRHNEKHPAQEGLDMFFEMIENG